MSNQSKYQFITQSLQKKKIKIKNKNNEWDTLEKLNSPSVHPGIKYAYDSRQ